MSSHKLTSHLHSFQSVSRFGTYASRNRPCRPVPYFFLFLTESVLWAYARLQSSSCVNLATSCNLVHVLTFYNFSFLLEPLQVVIAPAVQFLMDLCSASAIQPISFLFCCKSKLFNSKENCKSQIPDSLSCFSLWAARKRTNYTTALLPLRILYKAQVL